MFTDNNNIDILARLDAMRVQEETARCINYFKRRTPNSRDTLDQSARTAMVQWIQQVQKTLSLNPETVWIAMSYFDRYLSSGRGKSQSVLKSRCQFQLAAITCFYTAVKIYEPVVLGIDMLCTICRGTYTEADVEEMEKDILKALGWKVACHTPLDVARHLLELLGDDIPSSITKILLDDCQKHLDYAMTDMGFSITKTSVVGISCLAASIAESECLSLAHKQAIWYDLSDMVDFDLSSQEIMAAQQCLLSHSSPSKVGYSGSNFKLSSSSTNITSSVGSASPVCVSQTARQA
jgi:hypothetical protein